MLSYFYLSNIFNAVLFLVTEYFRSVTLVEKDLNISSPPLLFSIQVKFALDDEVYQKLEARCPCVCCSYSLSAEDESSLHIDAALRTNP